MDLDRADSDILNAVTENARLSLRKIAKKTGLAPATVMTRLKRLETGGIILRYSAVVDYDKLGFEFGMITSIHISRGMMLEVENELSKHPNVIGVYGITGKDDVIVVSRFKSRRAVDVFLNSIRKYDFVENSESSLILRAVSEKTVMF